MTYIYATAHFPILVLCKVIYIYNVHIGQKLLMKIIFCVFEGEHQIKLLHLKAYFQVWDNFW